MKLTICDVCKTEVTNPAMFPIHILNDKVAFILANYSSTDFDCCQSCANKLARYVEKFILNSFIFQDKEDKNVQCQNESCDIISDK